MSEGTPRIFVVGAFPPPIHGLAHANSCMASFFSDSGFETVILDTAHLKSREKTTSKIHRLLARMFVLGKLTWLFAAQRKKAILYLGISAGLGQIAEIPYPLIARAFGAPIVVHHHSFFYLNRVSKAFAIFAKSCGAAAIHIALCERMGHLMREKYSIRNIVVLSNAALTEVGLQYPTRHGPPRTLGFLSNITLDKGIDWFVDLIALLRSQGIRVEGRVAGPIEGKHVDSLLKKAVSEKLITYCGPVYGPAKAAFYRSIDVLVFPSRYKNEAEPFVILEALSSGVPVIGTDRGCTSSLVDHDVGVLLEAEQPDLAEAAAEIKLWIDNPDVFASKRTGATAKVRVLAEQANDAREQLISRLSRSG
jgi:glycosyltransferase involved in cell wall biosynthesis